MVSAPAAEAADFGTISPGEPLTMSTAAPDENATASFTGTADQRISLLADQVNWVAGSCSCTTAASVRIKRSNGTVVKTANVSLTGSSAFVDSFNLPAADTYTVEFDPSGTRYGSARFTLYNVPADFSEPSTPGQPDLFLPNYNPGVTVTTTTPGQNAKLVFNGAAGQRLSVVLDQAAWAGGSSTAVFPASVTVKDPTGAPLPQSASLLNGNTFAFIDTQVLPITGQYTVTFDPSGWRYGSARLTLYDVSPDPTYDIAPEASHHAIAEIDVPGQNAAVTFEGAAGQQVSVRVDGVEWRAGTCVCTAAAGLKIKKPDGTTLASRNVPNAWTAASFDPITLPANGRYTVVFDPLGSRYGTGRIVVLGAVTGNSEPFIFDQPPAWAFDGDEEVYPQEPSAFTDNYVLDENGAYVLNNEHVNRLVDASGNTLAAAGSTGTVPPLTLESLGASYPFGGTSATTDYIDARGSDELTYAADSGRQRSLGHDVAVYARAVRDPDDATIWLQYWLFYYYNSYSVVGLGPHEGDWEMIQIGLDHAGNPERATFSVHDHGYACDWSQVDQIGPLPVAYVAAKSHATYPFPGSTDVEVPVISIDHHRGNDITLIPGIVNITGDSGWTRWRGVWGASTSGPFESPGNPSQQEPKWLHPTDFHDAGLDCE